MAEINVKGFSGANNVKETDRFFVRPGIAEPRVILNADVDIVGHINKRLGKTLHITLSGAHSLWAGNNCMMCAANNSLYRIAQGVATSVGSITGPYCPLNYIDVDDEVYISNPYWQGVFNPSTNSLSSWGIEIPPGPMLLLGNGNLPAGTYHVCMTNVSGTEISGNSPISSITLTSMGGIQVLNRPAGALVWVTEANEPIFYLVGALDSIVNVSTVEPLPSFLCSPPPYLDNLCYAFGRIWGSRESSVYYSEPFKPGWFKLATNRFDYDSTITMIAKVPTGLFVGMNNDTKFMAGTDPSQMVQTDVGQGAVKGTLTYRNNLPDLSSVLGTAEKVIDSVPIWVSGYDVVAGNTSGKIYNLTKGRIKMSKSNSGASLCRDINGSFYFLTNFKRGVTGSGSILTDADTNQVFEDGRIDVHNKYPDDMTHRLGFSDSASCKVYRDGVEID